MLLAWNLELWFPFSSPYLARNLKSQSARILVSSLPKWWSDYFITLHMMSDCYWLPLPKNLMELFLKNFPKGQLIFRILITSPWILDSSLLFLSLFRDESSFCLLLKNLSSLFVLSRVLWAVFLTIFSKCHTKYHIPFKYPWTLISQIKTCIFF